MLLIWKSFCKKLQGHIQYDEVSDNSKAVERFIHHAKVKMFYWLNRRSQKQTFTWEQFEQFIKRHPVPKVKIYHRLFATTASEEICREAIALIRHDVVLTRSW